MRDSGLPQVQLNRKKLVKRVSVLIAVALVIEFLFLALFQLQEKQRHAALTEAFHQAEISLINQSFENEFADILNNLLVMGDSSEVAVYLDDPTSLGNIAEMARIFRNFQNRNAYYRSLSLYDAAGFPVIRINQDGYLLDSTQLEELPCLDEEISATSVPSISTLPDCPHEAVLFTLPVKEFNTRIGCYLQIEYNPVPLSSLIQNHAKNNPMNFYGLYFNEQVLYESSRSIWNLSPEDIRSQIETRNATNTAYTHFVDFALADLVESHGEVAFTSDLSLNFLIQSKPPTLLYLENPEINTFLLIEGMLLLIWIAIAIYLARNAAAREHARNQQRLMSEVLQSLNESLAITDDLYRVIYANPAFCRMLDYTQDEIFGMPVSQFRSKNNTPAYLRNISDSLLEKGVWEGKLWEQMRQGDPILKWVKIQKIVHPNRSVRYYGVYNDIDATRDTKVRDYHSTYYDLLTDLPNESLLPKLLKETIASHKQAKLQLGIAVIHLHPIESDTKSSKRRNKAVKAFAKRLMKEVNRSMGMLSRSDSTEFTLTFPNLTKPEDLFAALNRMKERLEEPFLLNKSDKHPLPFSIGLALYPQDGEDATKLMELARIQASNATQRVFQDSRQSASYRRYSKIDADLKNALRDNQFELNYQPQTDPVTAKPLALESLLRWTHPELGAVSPQEFIPIAENNGMIVPIGEWIFNEVCRFLQALIEAGIEPIPVSVNVSMAQLEDPHFVKRILLLIAQYHLPKRLIELEMTESMLMKNIRLGKSHLNNLTGLGFKLSIDDFGTGYSSLAYLKELQVDKVKLDRLFIKDYPLHDDGLVLRLIAQMLHGLSYTLLIEGVETEEQYAYVHSLNIDLIQGDYFSKPLPSDLIRLYLLDHREPTQG